MKILFLGEALSPHLPRWHTAFEKLGWEVLTASCDYDDKFAGRRLQPSISRSPLRYLSVVDQVEAIVREFQPHLINAHFLPNYGLIAAMMKAHPWALTLWGSDILDVGNHGLLRHWRSRYVLKRCDLLVADSHYALGVAEALVPARRRLVVSFGVRKSWFESGSTREMKETPALKILSTRRLEPLYDVATLLKAARLLKDSGISFQLTIAGDGSQSESLRSLARDLDLTGLVTFTGRQNDEQLFNLYRTHDVYVSTATSDSSSVSLLEAMSQRLYPVVTDIPGNREWITEAALLFKPSAPEELAGKIRPALAVAARTAAWQSYWPTLQQKGIREDQMVVADKAFRKLIDEYDRTGSRHHR